MNLTPTGRMIYDEYKKSKRQADFYHRAKRALKFNKEKSFQELTKDMNPYAKTILKMQINLCNKNKKGRRFSLEEKLIALSIMKQSPKCYRFLHKIFILPSRSTLNKMVAGLKIESGICPQVFEVIRRETEKWSYKKKLCSVIFDEMSLEAGLSYDKNKDKINGLVELGERKNDFADHALVFMLRGAVHKWQQPIAFYFCQGATKGTELKSILVDIITAVVGCGLKPISLICDQGSAFQAALNCLKADTARDQLLTNQEPDGTVTINEVKLMVIFDPPHLIKGLRNNFLNKDISFEGKLSTWRDIVDVYETDCNNMETRMLHKLNDQHVIPEKIKKMKVKNCVKVFSYTLSSALSYTANFSHYADGRPVSETLRNTAETVLFFDKLFDSINGSATYSQKKGKELRCAVTEKSKHHEFWPESIEKLEKIKYVDSMGNPKSVPSLKNFIATVKTFMKLWQFFKSKNMTIMRPRFFNSDPIENFFGQVRAYNYRNNDPNCHSFKNTFKSLLITRMIKFHGDAYNCEDDSADQIINLKSLFEDSETARVEPGHPKVGDVEDTVEEAQREQLNVLHSRAYTAGWVVTKTMQKYNNQCDSCRKSLTTKEGAIHKWIHQREYDAATKRLTYPSRGAVRCFGTIIKETNGFLEHRAHELNLTAKIMEKILFNNPFSFFKCTTHREILSYFISVTVKFSITNWCNNINKILKGTDIVRIKNRTLPAMQQKAFLKYKKRLRNKSFNK
ncbi:uncharacterized protein LOC134804659 [Cydia splendana]|uniref:uncharacterized protein LOC134795656 n=1 Tax=Cydia splendana TaxID=1100963 RepID=UPI00300CBBDB